MNRFISVVAGSVVPLIVSWSSQLVMSAGSVIVGGQDIVTSIVLVSTSGPPPTCVSTINVNGPKPQI